jgi:hypothetical protein
MPKTIDELCEAYLMRKHRFAERDQRNEELVHVMLGRFHRAFPSHFRSPVIKPMVANMLNVAAFDFADLLSPLPTVTVPAERDTQQAQKRADKRAQIIERGYWDDWKWAVRTLQGALYFKTFGYVPVTLWPYSRSTQKYAPHATFEDPCGFYPGPVESYGDQPLDGFVSWTKTAGEIASLYPEARPYLFQRGTNTPLETGDRVECARYHGDGEISLFLPDQGVALKRMLLPDSLRKPTLLMAMRPNVSPEEMQGQFDQLVGLLLGKARLTALVLTYAERQVHAPIEVDEDVKWEFGADALIRRPRGAAPATKVQIQMPADVWRELDKFERELRLGSRRPASRDGDSPVSYATGKGIDALEASVDSQLRTDQTIFGALNEDVVCSALALDEALYPNREQELGAGPGTYVPTEDIAGRYRATMTYGLLMGMNPSFAMVTLAQMNAARFASRRTAMENMPTIPELSREMDRIRAEDGEAALLQYIQGAAAAGDPTALQLAMELAPDSSYTRVVEKMLSAQQEGAQAASAGQPALPGGGAGPLALPAPPAPGGAGGPPAPEAVEAGMFGMQQGGGQNPRSLDEILGPLLAQVGGG